MSTRGRWARNSVLDDIYNKSSFFFESLRKVNVDFNRRHSKHTFFPGNEHTGSRIATRNKYLIDADSIFKVIWDITIMILTIIVSYTVPYSIAFFVNLSKTFYILVDTFFIIDILITFNTSYYFKGQLIAERSKISRKYLKNWFFYDLLASFPYEFFFFNELQCDSDFPIYTKIDDASALRFLVFLKLIRLVKYKQTIFTLRELLSFPAVHTFTSLFSYLFGASLILHWLVCLQNVLYVNSLFTSPKNYNLYFPDTKTRYLKLTLRSMETVTGVGFGEFPPLTILERIFNIFIMTLTSGFVGFYVGGVQSFLEQTNQIDYYFNDIMRKTKIYMKIHDCPLILRSRVVNYIRNLKKMHADNLLKEQDILSLLSGPMKEEVYANIQGHFLLRIQEFKAISSTCLKAVSYKMKLQMFGPSDRIATQGELTSDLFFVIGGHVEVFHNSTKTMFRVLGHHSYFGEISFFCSTPRTASVRSFDYCELLCFRQSDFFKILKNYPRDFEKIDVILRNIKRYGVGIMGIRCYLCENVGHCAINCLKYKFEKEPVNIEKKMNKVPKPKYDISRNCEIINRYSIRSAKSVENGPNFDANKFLKSEADSYSNWLKITDNKISGYFSLVKSLDEISEKSESDSDELLIVKMNYSWTKTEKLKTVLSESDRCDDSGVLMRKLKPIHYNLIND